MEHHCTKLSKISERMHARSFLRLSLFGIIVSSVIICRLPENGVPNGIRTIHDPEGSSSSSTPAEDGPDLELERHPCENGPGADAESDALTHSFYPNPNMPRKTGWAQSQVMRAVQGPPPLLRNEARNREKVQARAAPCYQARICFPARDFIAYGQANQHPGEAAAAGRSPQEPGECQLLSRKSSALGQGRFLPYFFKDFLEFLGGFPCLSKVEIHCFCLLCL